MCVSGCGYLTINNFGKIKFFFREIKSLVETPSYRSFLRLGLIFQSTFNFIPDADSIFESVFYLEKK